MRVRNSFVTNSSSTCYVCQVSGERASGMDIDPLDLGVRECFNGHEFMEDYMIGGELTIDEKRELLRAYFTKWDYPSYLTELETADDDWVTDTYPDWIGEHVVPASHCPICQMTHITDRDMLHYLLCHIPINREEVADKMRERYNTIQEMYEAFNED